MTDLQLTFLLAAATGNTVAIEQVYQANKSILSSTNPDGRTALHLAALHGHVAVTQQLLEYGISTSHKDTIGQTALHLAAQGSNPEVVDILLQNGNSGCPARDNKGKAAIYYAYQNPDVEVLARFQKNANACGSGCALTPSIILSGAPGSGDYFGAGAGVQASPSASPCGSGPGRGRAPTERTAIKS
ncbi:ankyrin repeat-containing domain protein [Aspergillus multicolor]|uniref:ankyrin repeat domain-containing protein n=1 Tax=Aspergillus multicolor TaxID=41759 RepID=UPI003CCDF28E